jgi:hypothetical protein
MGVQSLSSATEALEAVLNPPVTAYKTNGSMINIKGLQRSRAAIGDFSFAESFDMNDLLHASKPVEESGNFPMVGWFDDDDDNDEAQTNSDFGLIMPPSKRRCGGLVRSRKVESDLASLGSDSSSDIRHFPNISSHPLSSLSKISSSFLSNPLSSDLRLPPRPLSPRSPISPSPPYLSKSLSSSKSSLISEHMAYPLDPIRISFPGARVA